MNTNDEKPKRGRGQPSKGDDSRNITVAIKMSRNEMTAWRAAAAAQGMSFTGYLLEPRRRELKRRKGKT